MSFSDIPFLWWLIIIFGLILAYIAAVINL